MVLLYPLALILWKMAKNGHVHEGRKVGRSNATPTKLFLLTFMIWNLCHLNLVMIYYFWNAKGILHNVQAHEIKFLLFHPCKIKSRVVVWSIPWLWIVKDGQKWSCSWGWESRKKCCHFYQIFFCSFLCPCHLDLVMIPSLLWNAKSSLQKALLDNLQFFAIPSISNQRSLSYIATSSTRRTQNIRKNKNL